MKARFKSRSLWLTNRLPLHASSVLQCHLPRDEPTITLTGVYGTEVSTLGSKEPAKQGLAMLSNYDTRLYISMETQIAL